MKYFEKKDAKYIDSLEKDVKNRFCWEWLSKLDKNECLIEAWCKKIDVAEEYYCIWCRKIIKYLNGGLKSLRSHSESLYHKKAQDSVKDSVNLFSYVAESNKNETQTVDVNSRKV